MVDEPTTPEARAALRPGDMWYTTPETEWERKLLVAPEHAGQRGLFVRLPGPVDFAIYGPTISAGGIGKSGWRVTGVPPRLTVTPSINCHGVYHGYLTDGVITDECEGRKYTEDGRLIRTGS
jgi:hypothetical protein